MATNQMKAAEIRNWLADLAIGAKAMAKSLTVNDEKSWYEYRTYEDVMRDGVITVYVHGIVDLAKIAELPVQYREFVDGDFHYGNFVGEYFVEFSGVKFSDMVLRRTSIKKRGGKKK